MTVEVPGETDWHARRRAATGAVPLAALVLGVVLSIVGYRLINDLVRFEERSSFRVLAEQQASALQRRLERNIETVHALGGLFDASETVSRNEFTIFARQLLSRTTGVQALSWNPKVPREQLTDIKRLARQEGIEGYDFFEQNAEKQRQPLSGRSYYVPVLYVEPYDSNTGAVGYDVGSDPTRRMALDQARDLGEAVSSAPLKLVQLEKNEFAFLVFRPVYLNGKNPQTLSERRRNIRGYTVGVYRVADVLLAALGKEGPARTHVTIWDGSGEARSSRPIYNSDMSAEGEATLADVGTSSGLVHKAQLKLPRRNWTIVIRPADAFSSSINSNVAGIFLVAGAIVTLLVYGFLVSGRMRNQMIERQVISRTRELAAEIAERKGVEAALQERERTYAKLSEMAPVGILVFKNRIVDQANRAAVNLLGADSPEDLIGRGRQEFLRPDAWDEATRRWRSVHKGRALESWEVETVRLDGVAFSSVIRTESVLINGQIYAIVVIEDVSLEQRAAQALRESEEKYRSLIEFFPQGVLLSDQGIITQINPAGLKVYGAQDEKDVIGRDWMTFVAEKHREKMLERRRTLSAGSSVEPVELEMKRVDGSVFWGRSQAMPVQVSEETIYMTVFADITDRKLAEEEIRRANSELLRSNEELAQFAYVASHDLKEPLRMVSSYCGLLEARYSDKLDESGKKFIFYATDGARRMQTLIDDLLLYSRVGRGGETEAPVDLGPVVAEVVEMMSGSIRETGATINVDPLPVVSGFRGELVRLFQNLIGNAIKFRSEDVPEISIRCRETEKGVVIEVVDNGIGIPPEHREKVFGVFQRLHNRDKYEGTGIGLAVCEKIVEQMGGEIGIEESAAGGSVFVITIPGEKLSAL